MGSAAVCASSQPNQWPISSTCTWSTTIASSSDSSGWRREGRGGRGAASRCEFVLARAMGGDRSG